MVVEIINKVLMVIFILSTLNMFRHGFYFAQAWLTSTDEEQKKYIMDKKSLVILGLSISVVLTSIITGFGI